MIWCDPDGDSQNSFISSHSMLVLWACPASEHTSVACTNRTVHGWPSLVTEQGNGCLLIPSRIRVQPTRFGGDSEGQAASLGGVSQPRLAVIPAAKIWLA